MAYSVGTSRGGVYPNVTGVYINNPGYPADPDPQENIGSVYCGDDTFVVTQARVMGSNGIYVKKNALTPEFHQMYSAFTKVGFYATLSGHTVKVYYVCTSDPANVDGQEAVTQQTGSGALYGAYLLGTYTDDILERDWDETPKIDDITPTDPNGGEEADREKFGPSWQMEDDAMPAPVENDYSGMITAYYLPPDKMREVGGALFSSDVWQTFSNKFSGISNPMDFIIRAIEIPLAVSGGGSATDFKIGGASIGPTGQPAVQVSKLSQRFFTKTAGSIYLKEVWGTAKDYSGTSVSIFLPYVGVKELDPDIVIGTKLYLTVTCDMWTGDIVYLLHTDNADVGGKYYRQASVVYRWSGNCATEIPLGKVDATNSISGLGKSIAGGALMGAGAGAGFLGLGAGVGALVGGIGGLLTHTMQKYAGDYPNTVQTSGGVGGATGLMDYQYAYLIIKRSVPQYPEEWKHQIGAPRYQTYAVTDLHGFTVFDTINLVNMQGFSDQEIKALQYELCTEGIIL